MHAVNGKPPAEFTIKFAKFPVSRELGLESGSLKPPSTAIEYKLFKINNLSSSKTPELTDNSGVLVFRRISQKCSNARQLIGREKIT
jgi:hypothetical protein